MRSLLTQKFSWQTQQLFDDYGDAVEAPHSQSLWILAVFETRGKVWYPVFIFALQQYNSSWGQYFKDILLLYMYACVQIYL